MILTLLFQLCPHFPFFCQKTLQLFQPWTIYTSVHDDDYDADADDKDDDEDDDDEVDDEVDDDDADDKDCDKCSTSR